MKTLPTEDQRRIDKSLKPMYEGIEAYKDDAQELVDRVKRVEESTLLDDIQLASYRIIELAYQKYHRVAAENFWEDEILDNSEYHLRRRFNNLNDIPNINTYIKELEDIKKILLNWEDALKGHSDYKSDWVNELIQELELFSFTPAKNKKELIVIFDVSSSASLQKVYNGRTIHDLLRAYIFPILRKMDGELWEVSSGIPNKITPLKEFTDFDSQSGGGGTNFDDAFHLVYWERTIKQPLTEFKTILFTDGEVSWDTEMMPSNLLIVTENEKNLPQLKPTQKAIIISEEYAKGGTMARGGDTGEDVDKLRTWFVKKSKGKMSDLKVKNLISFIKENQSDERWAIDVYGKWLFQTLKGEISTEEARNFVKDVINAPKKYPNKSEVESAKKDLIGKVFYNQKEVMTITSMQGRETVWWRIASIDKDIVKLKTDDGYEKGIDIKYLWRDVEQQPRYKEDYVIGLEDNGKEQDREKIISDLRIIADYYEQSSGDSMARGGKFTGMKDLHIDMSVVVDKMSDKEVADYLKKSLKEFNENKYFNRELAVDKMTNDKYEDYLVEQDMRMDERKGLAKGGDVIALTNKKDKLKEEYNQAIIDGNQKRIKELKAELGDVNDSLNVSLKKDWAEKHPMARGGKTEAYKIAYLNKNKNHQRDEKVFEGKDAYEKAEKWGERNLDNFHQDMIRQMSVGGILNTKLSFKELFTK